MRGPVGHAAASFQGCHGSGNVDYLDKIIDPFLNPQKRVYLGYLIAAVLVAVGLSYILSGKSTRKLLSALFARRIWWSKSARADYGIVAINQAFMMGVMPRLVSKLALATILFETCIFGLMDGLISGLTHPVG